VYKTFSCSWQLMAISANRAIHKIRIKKGGLSPLFAFKTSSRTGFLQKLQQAMGYSSLAVALGYLIGLDIPQLAIRTCRSF